MNASIKNILIGLFVIFATGIIIFMLLFLHPSVGDNAKTLRVKFTDIDKVNVGTRVTYAGRPVGEVVSILEVPEARTSRLNQNGEVYVYELVLKVDSGVDVYNTDNISLRTSGLLGERNIEIDPRPLKIGEKLQRVEDEVIFATSTNSVETTLKQFEDLSNKIGVVLEDFHQIMVKIQEEKIVENISHSVNNVVEITNSLNQPNTWKNIMNNLSAFSESINEALSKADHSLDNIYEITRKGREEWSITAENTLRELEEAASTLSILSKKADKIIENTLQGKGSVGQLLIGNDFYLHLNSILYKGSTVMNDMHKYGILYHLDKRWQRAQADRLKLLQKLSNPDVFNAYFENEMSQVRSSLSNVAMILNKTECYPESLMHNPCFTQEFTDLLKRVEHMEEHLKMYNEQILNLNLIDYNKMESL